MRRYIVILSALLALVVIYSLTQLIPKESSEIKIGVVLPLTGKGANYGEKTKAGLDIAIKEYEKQGATPNISLIYEDTQADPKTAVAAVKKLIDVDKVVVIIGPIYSDNVLAISPIVEDEKITTVVTAAASDRIREAGDFIFRNRVSASGISAYLARYCYETLRIESVAVLYENSANAIDYKNGFIKEFTKKGGNVQIEESFEKGAKDFRTQIAKAKDVQPDTVFITGHATEIGLFLRQAHELGLDARFVSTPGAESDDMLNIAGNAAEGLLLASEALNLASDDPLIQEFRSKYMEKMNQEPDFFSVNAYDAFRMIVRAGESYGFTSDWIKEGLYALKDFYGVGGRITFDKDGEVTKPVAIKEVKNGKFTSPQEGNTGDEQTVIQEK